MIILDAKTENSNKSPNFLSLINSDTLQDTKTGLSFVELLKGVELGSNKGDSPVKFIPLESIVPVKDDASSSLKTLNIEINPLLTKETSLKELIVDAKKYLKSIIMQSSDYKVHEAKQLPKTLKGLVDIAEKLGLDIKKITYEDVREVKKSHIQEIDGSKVKTILDAKKSDIQERNFKLNSDVKEINTDLKIENKSKNKSDIKAINTDLKLENRLEIKSESRVINTDLKVENKVKEKLDTKTINTDSKLENKLEIKPEIKVTSGELKSESKVINTELKIENKEKVKPDIKATNTDLKLEDKSEIKAETKEQIKSSILLFKEVIKIPQKILTQDIIDVKKSLMPKDSTMIQKTSKQKADETLKLLLRGDKPQQTLNSKLTTDLSVATAKVIAPNILNNTPVAIVSQDKSIESLLRGDSNVSKSELVGVNKADSFEVKLNEAKQMIKYLSSDVKSAIEDYKSPFSRIRVQLNPQNLGAIDLTIVQRGKNLHVNLTSNNVAINALALNLNDLKTQFSNNGINNATFNFNSGSENSSSNNGQQHNSQNEQNRANKEYGYFDDEEQNEEVLNSLEIIVPSYA